MEWVKLFSEGMWGKMFLPSCSKEESNEMKFGGMRISAKFRKIYGGHRILIEMFDFQEAQLFQ